ncbi:MAG: glutaredoxin family protein [Acidobacteria bacterium]|nr:glutaredoxin family protein [Acidobacteriota bacterium]
MKELLSQERVAFIVRNVDEEDRAYDELLALGFQAVPVAVIGDRTIRGYDAAAILNALSAVRRHDE